MAITSNRSIAISFTEDLTYNQTFQASTGVTSPGKIEPKSLVSGNNTITVPDDATGCTIIPPEDNTGDDQVDLVLKGVNGDTGIALAPNSPTSLGLDEVSSFVINASDDLDVRLIFT